MKNQESSLTAQDREFVWHPYTQHGLGLPLHAVKSARGAWLTLEDGTELLDGISSWWVNLHGHADPDIARAISAQASSLEHVLFAGFTHAPAVRLAENLVRAARRGGARSTKCFYSDNGSTAVEVALKMAFQYHRAKGQHTRTRFIALSGAYHGDTIGAMAAGDPGGYHQDFRPLLMPVDFVVPGDLDCLAGLLEKNPRGHAALIVEPLIQGAGGMRVHSPEYLHQAAELCEKHGILLICDEVFTGFYRTGTCFAFEQARIRPDFICLSKGITGGFLPLAATLATEEIYDAFISKSQESAFLHGHSYTANPIACAAALASWEKLQSPDCQGRIREISLKTSQWTNRLADHPRVASARSLGTIGAVEVAGTGGYFSEDRLRLAQAALNRGVLLRPLGRVLYCVPPYCMNENELDMVYATIEEIIE